MRSNWSKLGFVAGFVWAVGFAVRYLFIWEDYSQAIVFVGIGLGLMAFSWTYDKILKLSTSLDIVEEWIDDRDLENQQEVS